MRVLFQNGLKRLQPGRILPLRLQGWWLRGQQVLLHSRSLVRRLPTRWRAVLTICVYGLGAGASAVAFQLGINWFYQVGFVRLSHQMPAMFYVGSFVLLVGSSLIVGWLLNSFCREAAGSGIPQLKLAFWKDFGFVPWRVVWVKFVAGIVSIGGGSSLGREGPSVQLAGALSSNLAGLAGEAKQNRRAPAAAGAAAVNGIWLLTWKRTDTRGRRGRILVPWADFQAVKYVSRFIRRPCLAVFDRDNVKARPKAARSGNVAELGLTTDWLARYNAGLV